MEDWNAGMMGRGFRRKEKEVMNNETNNELRIPNNEC